MRQEDMKKWSGEKEYLKDNPGKHKMNFFCDEIYELISVGGKKITSIELNKCIKFRNDKRGGESKPTKEWSINVDRKRNIKELWETKYIENVISVNGKMIGIAVGYISKKGMWIGYMGTSNADSQLASLHKIDEGILNSLPQILDEESSVVDFGCGNADYTKHLISEGFKCEAYDGNPSTPEMTDGVGKVLDLSEKFDLKKKFDYVISLEVAEHIPKEYEEIYVDNLIRHTEYYLITSWAVKGQGGEGHVNEQDEDYVLNIYKEKGMTYNKEVSDALRDVATLSWFKKTIFVFEKG